MHRLLTRPMAAVATVFLTATAVIAQARERGDEYFGHMWGDGHMWGGGYGMGYGIFGGLMMVLLLVIIVVFVVIAMRWRIEPGAKKQSSAIEILQERLAKGEIDPKEYADRRKALEG
jgi:putative membrane protein